MEMGYQVYRSLQAEGAVVKAPIGLRINSQVGSIRFSHLLVSRGQDRSHVHCHPNLEVRSSHQGHGLRDAFEHVREVAGAERASQSRGVAGSRSSSDGGRSEGGR